LVNHELRNPRQWNLEQIALQLVPERRVYSVSELNASIRATLESEFPEVRVAGEISGLRLAPSGHCYFTLKELDSQLKCVCYRSAYRYLRFKPKDGVAVVARGQIGVFEARGEYQLQVESLEPQGQGALQLAFEELKKRLLLEGLFEASRKRKIPRYPRKIGIVTSPRGAVVSDILHVLERRFPGLDLRIFPALVQGEGSIEEVCRAIAWFSDSEWPDVVIIARGGGSIEDLWTFNTELVARAIAACVVPVISAIGHETDVTIADFVADLRAPTPSAAAEILCATRQEILEQLAGTSQALTQLIRFRLSNASNQLQRQGIDRAYSLFQRFTGRNLQQVDDLDYRMRERLRGALERGERRRRDLEERVRHFDPRPRLEKDRNRLDAACSAAHRLMEARIARDRQRLESSAASLSQLSPVRILERGYALVTGPDGSLIRDASAAPAGTEIKVRLAAGRLEAQVTRSEGGRT
jgi:exodeoxyribonuclease VII large subunit